MLDPIEIHADFEADAYEITYRQLANGTFIHHDEHIAPCVTAGIGPDGRVYGIELLGLEPRTLAAARTYALAHGLAFPHDLTGVRAAS